MAKYRKKPVVIEAFQFGMQEKSDLPTWAKEALHGGVIKAFSQYGGAARWAEIETLEGIHRAEVGDYIIKGIKGELYPCRPDIFEATYEKIDQNCHLVSIEEIEDFIKLAESKISEKDGISKERQEAFVRGLKIMFNMFTIKSS